MTSATPRVRPVTGVVVFAMTAVLLTSIGGLGIAAAPVTLPLLFLTVRSHPTRAFRIAGAVIGGLTAAELAWGLLYVLAGEVPVFTWLLPLAAGLAMVLAFLAVRPSGSPRQPL